MLICMHDTCAHIRTAGAQAFQAFKGRCPPVELAAAAGVSIVCDSLLSCMCRALLQL